VSLDFNQILTDLRFWDQIHRDAKRTLVCSPTQADDIRRTVEEAGGGDIITVLANAVVPDGTMYVLDVQAMEAWEREQQDIDLRNMRIWP
jgi:hypothetical protein